MKTTQRTIQLRTRQTRKARAVVIQSGATAEEMRRMSGYRKRGAAAASTEAARPLRLRSRAADQSLVPAGKASREANVLQRTRAKLSSREKGRPTPGGARKTSLE